MTRFQQLGEKVSYEIAQVRIFVENMYCDDVEELEEMEMGEAKWEGIRVVAEDGVRMAFFLWFLRFELWWYWCYKVILGRNCLFRDMAFGHRIEIFAD